MLLYFFYASIRSTMPASINALRLVYVLNMETAPVTDTAPLDAVRSIVVKIWHCSLRCLSCCVLISKAQISSTWRIKIMNVRTVILCLNFLH